MFKNCILILFCFISTFFFFNSCSSDYATELSGNYFYSEEGGEIKQILNHKNNSNYKKDIYGKVIDYDFNYNYILVLQEPNYNDYITMIGFYLRVNLKKYPTNSYEETVQSEKEADSILTNDEYYKKVFKNKINYWIINNKIDSIFGPYSKQEYYIIRKKLGVPESLYLKNLP